MSRPDDPGPCRDGPHATWRARVSEWQDDIVRQARDLDLDVVRLRPDVDARELVLAEFVAERRLRKVS